MNGLSNNPLSSFVLPTIGRLYVKPEKNHEFESIVHNEDHSSEFIFRINSEKSSNLEENTLTCKFCCKTFTDKFSIRRHMKICNKSKKYDIRNKMFNRNGYLKIHMRIYTGESLFTLENSYKCKACLKKFASSSNVKIHENSYRISSSKTFWYSHDQAYWVETSLMCYLLINHMRIHSIVPGKRRKTFHYNIIVYVIIYCLVHINLEFNRIGCIMKARN
ncbi:hypothetical protein AGLY_018012 [Aphis glycines]|uniref:C2H2-type domain-containing protein n=1 Tax=Aphis glycines TaxID=307491 RepID=A0A6G0STI7_APHGL|nr:hypothetical protein AGLY_018012 [Aphis glycines]